jgi:hypothetical protein
MRYNVAISVVNDDLWIAKEFYYLLEEFSIPIFFYEESKDIKGRLLKNLEKIYKNSILDIIIVSHEYLTSEGVKNRITIDYVNFEINKNFQNDKLKKWRKLGDVLVELKNYNLNKFCYLIPSGRVPPFLSNSIFLKTNKTALKLKKNISRKFFKRK